MEASIVFHFAGRGNPTQRLALIDFAQLLDPRWKAPSEAVETKPVASVQSFLHGFAHSAYNFGLGGRQRPPGTKFCVAPLTTRRYRGRIWGYDRVPH